MKNLILATVAVVTISVAPASAYNFDENELEPVKKLSKEEIDKLTPEQLKEYKAGRHLYAIHRNGGIIWLPGKGKMLVSVVNDAVEMSAVTGCVGQVRQSLRINTEVNAAKMAEPSVAAFSAEMKKSGAQLGVFVVDSPALPQSLYAMEEGWAMANIAPLKADRPTSEKLDLRQRKAVARAFMLALGCATDQDYTSPMKPTKDMMSFDGVPVAHISFWNLGTVNDYMRGMGVIPDTLTTYKRAAIAGLAPAPTNKWQKAIWDEVHAMPSAPIKIKPEAKKVEK